MNVLKIIIVSSTAFSPLLSGAELKSPPVDSPNIGMRVDCLNNLNLDKGSTQECLSISGLRYTVNKTLNEKLSATLVLDPFGTPESDRAHLPFRSNVPTNMSINSDSAIGFGMVDYYKLNWQPRLNLNVAVEDYQGAATIPSVSGLSLGSKFQESGWGQTALTMNYKLSALDGMNVTFAAGNGEGENGINRDPQQYFGFALSAQIYPGIEIFLGASQDGNSVGSDAYTYYGTKFEEVCQIGVITTPKLGYSTQRLAAGLMIDGNLKGVEGLKVGLGFQRNILSDLDKAQQSVPTAEELQGCGSVNLDSLFLESTSDVNTVQKTIIALNVKYPFLQEYFVGFDFQQRRVDTGSVEFFQRCDGFEKTTCKVPGATSNNLSQDSITVGAGMNLADGLLWTLEYNITSYDQNYSNAYYIAPSSKATDTWEAVNTRFSYNWH